MARMVLSKATRNILRSTEMIMTTIVVVVGVVASVADFSGSGLYAESVHLVRFRQLEPSFEFLEAY